MTVKIDEIHPQFVEIIPEVLEPGIIYVSIAYRTASHLCCCGCGEKVVTPLSPADWEFTFNGRTISLWPSIAGGQCNSHYVIKRGRIRWARPLRKDEQAAALSRDRVAAEHTYDGPDDPEETPPQPHGPQRAIPWWRRIFS